MSKPPQPVFLERQGYRRRRLADAARMLPISGAALLLVPLLWPRPEPATGAETQAVAMSSAILYIFAVWALLVVLSALFGLSVRKWGEGDSPPGQGRG